VNKQLLDLVPKLSFVSHLGKKVVITTEYECWLLRLDKR
jgi:hypothetical protein